MPIESWSFDAILAEAKTVVENSGVELLFGVEISGFNIRTGADWWAIVHVSGLDGKRLGSITLPLDSGQARAAKSLEGNVGHLLTLQAEVDKKEGPAL